MYKIIGADKKEYGPVSVDQLHSWISEGRANAHSLVQLVGTGEWKPLSAIPEFDAVLRLHAEPLSPPPIFASTRPQDFLTREPELKISACLSGSWNLLTQNFGLLFVCSLLVWLISTACHMNAITGLAFGAIQGVIYGGLYMVFLKRIRSEPASVGDTFSGFSMGFAQLLLAGLISNLVGKIGLFFCLLPGIYLLTAWAFSIQLVADKRMEFWAAMEVSRKTVTRIWFAVFALVVLAFLPTILFQLFVLVKIYHPFFLWFNEAISHGQPSFEKASEVLLQILQDNQAIIWLEKIVLLLNMPFGIGALMYGYENLFGSRKA